MNPIVANAKLKLAVLKNEEKEASIKLSRLFLEAQSLLCPYFDDIDEVKAEEIEQTGDDILAIVNHLKDLKVKIKQIERDLR